MLWTIIKKEFIQQILTRKLLFSLLITLILTFLALHISVTNYLSKFEGYSEAASKQQLASVDVSALEEKEFDSYDWTNLDYSVFRKPTPLSIYCQGMENNFGVAARLDPMRVPYSAQPLDRLGLFSGLSLNEVLKDTFSVIDFTLMIKFFFSIVTIIIGFDIVSSEREQGTLKMIHAQNVSRRTLINAKWLANFLILSICVVFFFLLSILYLMLNKDIHFNAEDIARLLLLFILSLFFVLFFFQTAMFISCIFRSSQSVLVTVFLIWILSHFIFPNISMLLAKRFSEIPTLDYTHIEEQKISKTFREMGMEASKSGDRDKVFSLMYERGPVVWNVKQNYINRLKNQRNVYEVLSLISPSQVYSFAAEHLMGTSIEDYDNYMERVRFENNNYSKIVQSMMGKSPIERRSLSIESFIPIAEASAQNNRIPISKSIFYALPYFIWLIIVNGFLYFFTLLYYDRKTIIL